MRNIEAKRMEKGVIELIGTVSEDEGVRGWIISGGDYPGIDYGSAPPKVCGYTIEELKQICQVKETFSSLSGEGFKTEFTEVLERLRIIRRPDEVSVHQPIKLTIPSGRYTFGVFHKE